MSPARIVIAGLRALRHLTPPARRDWLRAMEAEVDVGTRESGPLWAWEMLGAACWLTANEGPFALSVTAGMVGAGIIWWDWHTVDSVRVVVALLAAAALVSAWLPRAFIPIGASLGSAQLFAHGASDLTGMSRPFYCWTALSLNDWITIAAVLPATILAAGAGAAMRSSTPSL